VKGIVSQLKIAVFQLHRMIRVNCIAPSEALI